jgi:hypothetical protein
MHPSQQVARLTIGTTIKTPSGDMDRTDLSSSIILNRPVDKLFLLGIIMVVFLKLDLEIILASNQTGLFVRKALPAQIAVTSNWKFLLTSQ